MKAKTIKTVLRKKVDDWLASIDDEELRKYLSKNVIVTGGCIASMLLREKVNDYDVYFRTRDAAQRVANYYVDRYKERNDPNIAISVNTFEDWRGNKERLRIVVKSAGVASESHGDEDYQYFETQPDEQGEAYLGQVIDGAEQVQDTFEETNDLAREVEDESDPYRPVFLSTNAIMLAGKVQLVIRFFGEPANIHKNYDFVHCTNYWTSWETSEDCLHISKEALESLITRELRYVGSLYPLCSLIRVRKFVSRNWTINAGQIVKMCLQLNELDLNKIEVLEDQLTGVDVAYFCDMLTRLKDKDKQQVDSAYLMTLIDRMF